ncbi:hypothetical protein ACHAQA_003732 [Verticillium albo-atrum]
MAVNEVSPNEKNPKPQIIRQLGPMESYHMAAQVHNVVCNVILACRYTIPGDLAGRNCASEVESWFENAVATTVLEQPLLQVGIIGQKTKKPSWVHLQSLDLRYHVQWVTVAGDEDGDFDTAYAVERRAQLGKRSTHSDVRPGWRVIVWRKEGLPYLNAMFIWDHVSSDGTGSKIFHKSLLRNLNAPAKALPGLRDHILQTEVTQDKFPPPQERLINYTLSLGYTISTAWNELKPPIFVSKDSTTQATWAPIKALSYETQVRLVELSDTTLQRVLASCRQNKTTLTALLHGITLVSMASQLRPEEAPGFVSLTALDMRRFVSAATAGYPWIKADQTVENIVSKMDHHFDTATVARIRDRLTGGGSNGGSREKSSLQDLVWASAAAVRKDIEEELKKNAKNNLVGLMKLVNDWGSYIKDGAKKPRPESWLVTSLGIIDGQNHVGQQEGDGEAGKTRAWSIDQAVFSLCAATNGPVFQLSPVSVLGKGLWVEVSWQDGVVEASMGDRLATDVESWLEYLGQPADELH